MGEKIKRVTISVPREVYKEMDKVRGYMSRSCYMSAALDFAMHDEGFGEYLRLGGKKK